MPDIAGEDRQAARFRRRSDGDIGETGRLPRASTMRWVESREFRLRSTSPSARAIASMRASFSAAKACSAAAREQLARNQVLAVDAYARRTA
jgi:hypothetical protein